MPFDKTHLSPHTMVKHGQQKLEQIDPVHLSILLQTPMIVVDQQAAIIGYPSSQEWYLIHDVVQSK
jgi:hypothetical protein